MAEDIFKYSPATEWNGMVVDFDMPSTDGDLRLTELCLAADSCLEATKFAIDLSWIHADFAKARTPPVLEIVRTLFGADGDDVITYPLIVDGVYYITPPPTDFAIEFPEKDWEVKIVNDNMDIALRILSRVMQTEVGVDEWYLPFQGQGIYLDSAEQHAYITKLANNPYWEYYYPASSSPDGFPTYELYNYPTCNWFDPPGNWDTDCVPDIQVKWNSVYSGHCSDGQVPSDIYSCEQTVRSGFCRQTNYNEPLVVSKNHTGRCFNNDYKTRITCENAGYDWNSMLIPYSNKEITFPASDEAYKLKQPLDRMDCHGITVDPEWDEVVITTPAHMNNNYQWEFHDLQTPLGYVPGTAVITKIRFRGDFDHYNEYVDFWFSMSGSFTVGKTGAKSGGHWQEPNPGAFDYYILSGYQNQMSDLGSYQGQVGFWAGFSPSMDIDESHNYCEIDGVAGDPTDIYNQQQQFCEASWWGGTWLAAPYWQLEFTVKVTEEVGALDNWTNNGKCLYTSDQWAGGAGSFWKQEASFDSRELCMETSQSNAVWDNYYLMWIEDTNTWTNLYHNWYHSVGSSTWSGSGSRSWYPPGGGPYSTGSHISGLHDQGTTWQNLDIGNMAIDGTIHHHRRYNILTSDDHRLYPKKHIELPNTTGNPGGAPTNLDMGYFDTNLSWGNGLEVGRSTIPMWVTSTFAWPDKDRIYDYCHDTGSGVPGELPQPQWSLPAWDDLAQGNSYQGEGCFSSGTCSGNSQWNNNQQMCRTHWSCSNTGLISYYGPSSQTCTDNGYVVNEWDNNTEEFLNTWTYHTTQELNCYRDHDGSDTGVGQYRSVHRACDRGGTCNNSNCSGGNYADPNDCNPYNCNCYNGQWTTQYRCEQEGICTWMVWTNNQWYGPYGGSNNSSGSNSSGWCTSIGNYFNNQYPGSYSTFTSANNTWTDGNATWALTWTWQDDEFWYWKTQPKIETEMPIDLDDPSLNSTHYQGKLMLNYPSHGFVQDTVTPSGGWCSDDGTASGNLVGDHLLQGGGQYNCGWGGECSDPQWTNYYGNGESCTAVGTCSDPLYNNNQTGCTDQGTCSHSQWNNNPTACISDNLNGTCSDPQFTNSWDCLAAQPPINTWTPNPGIWTPSNTWTQTNTWTNYGWGWIFHTSYFASEPRELMGYHTPDRPEGALIRWKPPASHRHLFDRMYTRPTHYRIYRAPWVSPEGLSFTNSDYEAKMWKMAGEVPSVSDDGWHYFTDTKEDLFKVGVGPFDRVYYRVTAVWDEWNWHAGFHKQVFGWDWYNTPMVFPGSSACPVLTGFNWDRRWEQYWDNFGGTDENGATERINGDCSHSLYDGYETGCLAEGTCNENTLYNNNQSGCLAEGTCNGNSDHNNDEYNCSGNPSTGGTCSDSQWDGDKWMCIMFGTCSDPMWDDNEWMCQMEGTCSDPMFDDYYDGCILMFGTCSDPNITDGWMCEMSGEVWTSTNTWTPDNTWTQTNTWYPNTWTSAGNTWTSAGNTWTPGTWTGPDHLTDNPDHPYDTGYTGCWTCQGGNPGPLPQNETDCAAANGTWTSIAQFYREPCQNLGAVWYQEVDLSLLETSNNMPPNANIPLLTASYAGDELVSSVHSPAWPDEPVDFPYNTFKYWGYFKAPTTGLYQFKVSSKDSSYLWVGINNQTLNNLIANRNKDNFLAGCPGMHGDSGVPAGSVPEFQYNIGRIELQEGHRYPVLMYFMTMNDTGNHTYDQSGETGKGKYSLHVHIPDGDWNNGGNGEGQWTTGTTSLMPGILNFWGNHSGMYNNFSGFGQTSVGGQFVEGKFTNEGGNPFLLGEDADEWEGDVYSFYTT